MSETIVNCAAYSGGKRVANIALSQVHVELEHADEFVWVGLHEPESETLKLVQQEFHLHELAIEDALRAHQRPKLELYGDSLFIVLRTAQINPQTQKIEFGETHFFMGKNFLVTVRHGSSLAYTEVRTRCERMPHLLSKGPAFALYAVMDSIVDQYFPVIEMLEHELEKMEEKVFAEKYRRETTEEIYDMKRQLLDVKRAVSPLIDICNKLMRFDLAIIDEETRPYFRDVYDHSVRINEMVDNARELLSSALEANFSMISISQNEVSKKFAGWAAIIAVPTMIAGFYGMNFKFIPELEWHYGYFFVIGITVLACGTLYYFFKRSGWF
ncbi:MAG: magnesium/cobalt transporter CorA [Sphingobacteriales bacterium]|nr:magnesium/cobalt transporter CorA [Sphingobacteriales bacterium]MBI3719185.1 magnesium/cobalt transporter CorA [Sphingobacteriales bacterium]